MNKKRYFIIFLIILGLLLGTFAIISYIEDPAGIFTNGNYERGVADILLSGKNVARIGDYDDRLLQKDLIKKDARQIGIIVLGSSRSMMIQYSPLSDEKNNEQSFFNHGVSGASIEDFIALLELYAEKDALPKKIIIGVDPWILNANNSQKRWVTLKKEYVDGCARINSTLNITEQNTDDFSKNIDKYTSLISRPIIIKSIERLLIGSYYATDLNEADVGIKLSDGTINYPKYIRNRNVMQVDTIAYSTANENPIDSLGNFNEIDGHLKIQFESIVHYLKSKNSTIILFLPPYHPIVYNEISTNPKYLKVKEAELYFKTFAASENIMIIGSYDPDLMNLSSTDFYDGIHLRRESIDKIFAAEMNEIKIGVINNK